MNLDPANPLENAFGTLQQLARRKRSGERCELCSVDLGPPHPHLLELSRRRLVCACEGCALLFSSQSAARYKRVPRRVLLLQNFRMTDAQWDGLMVPINMAFFFRSSLEERIVALYPSPAGATESLLPLETWSDIVLENPVLAGMESDVEALLANRVAHARGAAPAEYYLVPIDQCYKLVGIMRMHWKGLSGGTELWQALGDFFTDLRGKARVTA